MLIKQLKRFCKKLRKPGSDVVVAAVGASRPSLTLTIGSSARPDSVVVHEDQDEDGGEGMMNSYTPVFLNRAEMMDSSTGSSTSSTISASANNKAGSCRTLMMNHPPTAELGYGPSRGNKSIDLSRPPFVPHPHHHRLHQHSPARRSIDIIPPPPSRPVHLARPSGSFPPYTPSPPISIHANHSSSNLLLSSSASSQHHKFSSSPKAMMTPLPNALASQPPVTLTSVSAHLDAQMEALDSVFSKIRAAQNLKKEDLQSQLEQQQYPPSVIASPTHLQEPSPPPTPIKQNSLPPPPSKKSLSAHYALARRSMEECTLSRRSSARFQRPRPQIHPITPEQQQPTPATHQQSPTTARSLPRPHSTFVLPASVTKTIHMHASRAAPPTKHRADSGFHKNELDCLLEDMQALSLEQIVQKYQAAGRDMRIL